MHLPTWVSAAFLWGTALAYPGFPHQSKLKVHLSAAKGVIDGKIDGHVQLLFAPAGTDPLDDTDVDTSPDFFYGENVFGFHTGSSVILSGGNGVNTDFGVYGWPNVSLDDLAPGDYSVQAFINVYETVTRADGSTVSLRFPCGDGGAMVDGFGSPKTSVTNVTVTGKSQTINLVFDSVEPAGDFTGHEIGGCQQGNYEDTEYLKYVKIRSEVLSAWWKRDVYVGANVLLPHGYDANDKSKRYPVVYSQGHWPGAGGAFRYATYLNGTFASAWNSGTIPATNTTEARDTPKLILVTFRHENAYYDDSYAVNTANLGPWGDAINDELIPHLDATFNTIAKPYARIQEGGSTGGWESIASLIFRPDLFGVTFTSYPDSLDFHSHQAIPLYTNKNAYVYANGSSIPDIREMVDGVEEVVTYTAQENHWELTYGTSSRSFGQWDIWNAVFGIQGLNGYPLEPWDKVTGEIDHAAVEYWKHLDLSYYVTSNWDNSLNLGEVLKNRIYVYVGTLDTYYLNLGVELFQDAVTAKGGSGWANFTYGEGKPHGGIYNLLPIWTYLDMLETWVEDHAPTGKTPLSPAVTVSSSRGNKFADVMAYGGHKAALARQEAPTLKGTKASVGRWDPGVALTAQWIVDGRSCGKPISVKQGAEVKFPAGGKACKLQIAVTGTKRGYKTETRKSNTVGLWGKQSWDWGFFWGHKSHACPL